MRSMITENIDKIPYRLDIPGLTTGDNCLILEDSWGGHDSTISMDFDVITLWAISVIRRETAKLVDVDLKKLDQALNSKDEEVYNVFIKYLRANTRYAGSLIHNIRIGDRWGLVQTLKEYVNNNKFNLTDEVR